MAIISMQRTPKGYAEYWTMGRVDIDFFSRNATVKLHGFPDKTFADELGAVAMESIEVTVLSDRFDEYFYDGADYKKNAYRIFKENIIEGATTYDFREGING